MPPSRLPVQMEILFTIGVTALICKRVSQRRTPLANSKDLVNAWQTKNDSMIATRFDGVSDKHSKQFLTQRLLCVRIEVNTVKTVYL